MTLLIPENLRSTRDVEPGVARLARVVQGALDDAATLWFEPLFDGTGERPDLVLLVPDAGILVIEVLETKAGALTGVTDGRLVVRRRGADLLVDDPLSRARAFATQLSLAIAGDAGLSADERLPVAAAAAFAYLSRDDATRKALGSTSRPRAVPVARRSRRRPGRRAGVRPPHRPTRRRGPS